MKHSPIFDIRLVSVSLVVGVLLGVVACMLLLLPREAEEAIELLPREREQGLYHPEQKGPGHFEIPVSLTIPVSWNRIDRLVLLVSLSRRALPLANAHLTFPQAGCSFESRQSTLYDNGELILIPSQCDRNITTGEALEGRLIIELASPHTLALIASHRSHETGRLLRLGVREANGQAPYAMGRFMVVPVDEPVSRAQQIAAIWTLPWLSWAAPLAVSCSILLATIGGALLSLQPRVRTDIWCRAIAAGMFALSLGLVYGVLVPPFHAPDEPDHFLSFARLAEMPELESDARILARKGHFERIHFHQWERFLPRHMEQPYPDAWTEVDESGIIQVADSAMETRSTLTTGIWKACAFLFKGAGAAKTLLGLRLVNTAFWALACIIGVLLIEKAAPKNRVFPAFLFLVPSLPFFAMHLSNFAQYTHVLTMLSCFTLGLYLRGKRLQCGGLLLGLFSAAVVLAASSGIVMLGCIGCIALGRLVVVMGNGAARFREAATFWLGMVLGWAPILLFIDGPQFERLEASLRTVLAVADPSAANVFNAPFIITVFLASGLIGVTAEMLLSRTGDALRALVRRLITWVNWIAALAVGVLLVYAPYTQYVNVPSEMRQVGVEKYINIAIYNLFSSLTFREPDLMLSTTFWSGFGWHDVFFDPLVVQIMAGIAGCGLFLALMSAGADYRRSARLLAALFGALVSGILMVFVVASGAGGGQPNVHGRYLLGTYLVVLSLAFAGFAPAVWRFAKAENQREALDLDWRGQRTGVELLMTWGAITAGGMTMYMAGWPWIFPTLPVPLAWLYFLFAIVTPFFCVAMIRSSLQGITLNAREYLKRSPRPGYYLAIGLVVFSILAFTELTVNLPKAVIYNFDFYTLLPTIMALLFMLWYYKPTFKKVASWVTPATYIAGSAVHLGCLAFLLKRYFG